MKKYLIFPAFLISIIFLTSLAMSAGSVTITSQVLDSTVRPGGETTVFLTVANPSTTTSVTTIGLYIFPGPYITPSINYVEIGGLDASSSQQTSLTVKVDSSAVSTTSYIKVKASYYSGTTQYETNVNVPITIRRIPILQLENVNYVPAEIEPGNSVLVGFDLKNEGDGSAKDVRITLSQTTKNFIVEGSAEKFIDAVSPKQSAPISFNLVIDPSVSIGTFSIPVSLTYLDETKGVNYSTTKYIGLTVSGKYNFIITKTQDAIAPGKTGKASLEIANGGSQEALYLTLKVLPSDPLSVPQSEIYLGNLKSDEFDTQDFSLKVDKDASPGVYPLNLQLLYKDAFGNSYDKTYNADITVSSLKEFEQANKGKLPTYVIFIIIFILVIIAYIVYKRLKKRK